MRTLRLAAIFAVTFLLSGLNLVRAADGVLATETIAILNDGWSGTDAALAQADAHLTRAHDAAAEDVRPQYAYALVQLKGRKFKEARATLEEIVAKNPQELAARKTLVWLTAYLRDYSATLSNMSALAKQLPATESGSKDSPAVTEAVTLLGKMFGFLAGPAPDNIPESQLKDAEKMVRDSLSESRRTIFDNGRKEILKQFSDLKSQKDKQQEDAKKEEAKHKSEDQPKVASERAALKSDEKKLEDELTAAKSALDSEEQKLKKEMTPLKAEGDGLAAKEKPLNTKIQNAEKNASSQESQASSTSDKAKAAQLRSTATSIRNSVANDKQELTKLQTQYSKLQGEYNQLQAKANSAAQKYRAESGKIAGTLNQLKAKEKILDQREQDDKKPATGESNSVKSLEAKLTALATYLPLSLDEEKQRLIESFDKP